MPTGYTAAIKDGISFDTFIMNCARAFGACVTLRDTPGGGEAIPTKFEPSDYHAKAIAEARTGLAALAAMTQAEIEQAASNDYDQAETNRLRRIHEIGEQAAAYRLMLAHVERWQPPTADHEGLKSFMRQQIEQSIDFDCSTDFYDKPTKRQTGEEWADARRAALVKDIAYHDRNHTEEVERAASRTAWVNALRESLRDPEQTASGS